MIAIFEYSIFIFFAFSTLYVVIFSISGLFYKNKSSLDPIDKYSKIAILIPAYKEDGVIIPVSESMTQLDYPNDKYDVFVLADQLQQTTLDQLKPIDVEVMEVKFEKSTKTKSLNYCLSNIDHTLYDLIMISDADNILAKNFLNKINEAYQTGHDAIQGRRVAKNLNSDFAVLDGASEIINNHIFRKGPNAMGLSASLIGSGMAFKTSDVVDCLNEIKAVGGFDKVLQLKIIEKGNTIKYLDDALIYDEKIESIDNFKNQRKRWLASQYLYLAKYFGKGLGQLFRGRFDYFNIAVLHNLFLPRVINLGCLFILALISTIIYNYINVPFWYWIGLFIFYLFALLIALPKTFFNKKLFLAVFTLPKTFWSMFMLLFKLKGADKKFIHTKHSHAEIDNDLIDSKND